MISNLLEILTFGSLILLGIILIANPLQVNKRANSWFGVFLFLWATFWLDEIISLTNGHTIGHRFSFFLSFIQFLTPLAFYFSIRYFSNPDYKLDRSGLLYLVLPVIYLLVLILDNMRDIDLKAVLITLMFMHGFTYILLSILLISKHKRHIQQFSSSPHEIDLSWLVYIIWAMLLFVLGIGIFNLLFFDAPLNIFMNGFAYLVVLFTAYYSLKQKEIFPMDVEERADVLSLVEAETDNGQSKLMTDEKLMETKAQLIDLITREELYLDNDLSLGKLAKKLEISSHHLSYVINTGFNQNFYGFINKFRVEKAKKLLADKTMDKFSILGIALESGFNSKTSFNTAFKKLTGQTPSEFKKTCSDL